MEENKNLDTPSGEFESNEARRQRLLGIENDSKIHDETLEIKKGNFFANLWYKHKWAVLITSFFVVLGIALLGTYIFKDRPDMRISYCGPVKITEEKHQLLDKVFSSALVDYDKDDENELTFTQNTYLTAEQKEAEARKNALNSGKEYDESAKYSDDDPSAVSNALRMSEYNFVIIDKALFDKFKNNFTTIKSALGEAEASKYSDITVDDCGIYLKKTELGRSFEKELSFLPDDTIIAICKPAVFDKDLDNEYDYLKRILTYTETEE